MTMSINRLLGCAAAMLCCIALPVQAHKMWMAPSKTVLNVGQWVTVDAGTSTDPFVKDHRSLGLEALTITAPDGTALAPANAATGELRSTFDLKLDQAGTYRLAVVRDNVSASWDDQGKHGRWPPRGQAFSKEGLAAALPKTATDVKVTRMLSRLETFVTAGSPNDAALKLPVEGLAMQAVVGVNDLYSDEPAQLRFVLDGKPAAGLEIEVIADGVRYRNAVDAIVLKTDADGLVSIAWPRPGLYWIGASFEDARGTKDVPNRRFAYAAVLEVLNP